MQRLYSYHYQAMNMREEGKKYAEIAEELDKHENTVINWFTSKDYELFQQEYEEFKQERIQEIKDEAKDQLKKATGQATKKLIDLLDADNEFAQLQAAKEILNRVDGTEEKQKIEQTNIEDGSVTVKFVSDSNIDYSEHTVGGNNED